MHESAVWRSGKVVLSAQGIKREDKEGRDKYFMDMVAAFDAPCLILACISRDNLVEYQMLDIALSPKRLPGCSRQRSRHLFVGLNRLVSPPKSEK